MHQDIAGIAYCNWASEATKATDVCQAPYAVIRAGSVLLLVAVG